MAALPISDEQLTVGRRAVAAAALEAARESATRHLIGGLGGLSDVLRGDADGVVTKALQDRDFAAHAWLAPYEVSWCLLVVQFLSGANENLANAVRLARDRGATVPEIAAALGTSTQNVYTVYADQVVRRRRTQSE